MAADVSGCETCGMFLHPDTAADHECPEPLPYDVAHSLAATYSMPGMPPIHPRLFASIRRGLESGEPR